MLFYNLKFLCVFIKIQFREDYYEIHITIVIHISNHLYALYADFGNKKSQ